MGVVDTLIAAVQGSQKLDEGKRTIVVAFLQALGPTLDLFGQDGIAAVMGAAASGGSVTDAVAAQLSAAQVADFLETTEKELASIAEAHGAQIKAAQAAVAQLESAALMAVAQALIGAI